MEIYTYRPLSKAPYSTRLIQILPGTHDSEITCVIHDYTLRLGRTPGPYEALSYVWGDQNQKRRVYIQDARTPGSTFSLDVTANLYVALRRLRDTDFVRLMWIDALSIDQESLEERGIQVAFMAMVYSHAKSVLVWLGEEADGSSELFDSLVEMAVIDTSIPVLAVTVLEKAIATLLQRHWFQRIWVSHAPSRSRFH
jgi:hypothetical protein